MFYVINLDRLISIIDKEFRMNTSSSCNWYVDENYILNVMIDLPDCKHTYLYREQLSEDNMKPVDFRVTSLLTKSNEVLGIKEDETVKNIEVQTQVIDPLLSKLIYGG